MTRYFVISYKRSLGSIIEVAEFEGHRDAFAKRLELDLRYRQDPDVEVAMLSASSLSELKKTHSRYFRSLADIAAG